jgi:hypothetical protein
MSINSGENTPRIALALCAVATEVCTFPIASAPSVVGPKESTPLIARVPGAVAQVGRTHYIAAARTVVDMGDPLKKPQKKSGAFVFLKPLLHRPLWQARREIC